MFGTMSQHYEALAPQWVTTQNTQIVNDQMKWYNVTDSASEPLVNGTTHSMFAQFSATCMYFGIELVAAREAQGLDPVPIGLIQSAIGG